MRHSPFAPKKLDRRAFVRGGVFGAVGLPALLQARTARGDAPSSFGRARRCLLVFLTGGPPQHDTWDPKPAAPADVRGELRPIATTVPGIHFSELCPRLARQAHRFCVVRSVTHGDSTHTSAGYTMLTGAYHPRPNVQEAANIRPSANDHPHLGALLSLLRPAGAGSPPFVSLPEVIKDAAVNEFPGQGAGFLGRAFDPLRIEANAARTGFELPEVAPPRDVGSERMAARRRLLGTLDESRLRVAPPRVLVESEGMYERAFDIVRSPEVQRALHVEREPERTRALYGSHLFGQGCLLGRRLLEAGVPLVTVYWHYEGPDDSPVWDTHENNFAHLRNRLVPPADRAIAALLEDLAVRGLLNDTLVVCMGEFGRTPRINRAAGRDHWPHVQSILLAGAGIGGGRVYGSSDQIGAYPATQPVSPPDLFATFLHLLGVPPGVEVHDRTGRPLLVCSGNAVMGLIGGG